MKQITLNIPDNKFKTFVDFIQTLDYVKIQEVDHEALIGLENSLKEVKAMKDGKIEKKRFKDLIDEI
ncbi:hypothetical protein [Cognataquiflexum aquatile]|jgi:hypothetical protein|uniref:hypothetical protein n=1 Tax=Cognataquiflexum aquatile TaxID=2249427 RepID=UPI000DEAFD2C|nr:hypothetical protein [Cognataquiflexum aquatile]